MPAAIQRATCFGCPVRLACLDYALTVERDDQGQDGRKGWPVYGGMTGPERYREQHRRDKAESELSMTTVEGVEIAYGPALDSSWLVWWCPACPVHRSDAYGLVGLMAGSPAADVVRAVRERAAEHVRSHNNVPAGRRW